MATILTGADTIAASLNDACIGAIPGSDPQVHSRIVADASVDGGKCVWVVRDTHNSHEDRWVDVAYMIKLPTNLSMRFKAGFVFIECKTRYKDNKKKLARFLQIFFKNAKTFARTWPVYYFMAVFVCEYDFTQEQITADLPPNLATTVVVINEQNCPWISHFSAADPSKIHALWSKQKQHCTKADRLSL